jgi:hypothetical protein
VRLINKYGNNLKDERKPDEEECKCVGEEKIYPRRSNWPHYSPSQLSLEMNRPFLHSLTLFPPINPSVGLENRGVTE